jgi:hypothetical protein
MIKLDVPVVLIDPGLNGMFSLSNAYLATLTGDTVYIWCSQHKVILDRVKDTGKLPRWERPPVLILCLGSTLLMQFKVGPIKVMKTTDVRTCLSVSSPSGGLRE